MSAVDLEHVLDGLRGFQRDAVEHVCHQFYGPGSEDRSGRFLIADETGLGKSVVARGVVAKAIRELEADDAIGRIDIVYICSNRDLAQQNLKRLNVTGQPSIGMSTRLSLLATQTAKLSTASTDGGKPVNLVSFTPGTSFDAGGQRQGSAKERALLSLILDEVLNHDEEQQLAGRTLLQQGVSTVQRFVDWYIRPMRDSLDGPLDPNIVNAFRELAGEAGALSEFARLRDATAEAGSVPDEEWDATQNVIGRMRALLAKASVETLEPDLVILDEFQRFKHLLDLETGGDAAELAHGLFEYRDAKVLLLSATPYKPFTKADEDDGEDHYEDFLATIGFLAGGPAADIEPVKAALAAYRSAALAGQTADAEAAEVRRVLLPYMSRSERPPLVENRDLVEVNHLPVTVPSVDDLRDWKALADLGNLIDSPMNLEYWKSAPYFVNFMDGYQTERKLAAALKGPNRSEVGFALRATRSLKPRSLERHAEMDPGNGPLRALVERTLDRGWWKLLWMPPSMPYTEPGPVYRAVTEAGDVTKQVLFSAWSATPTAVAAILSHEADRRMFGIGSRGLEGDEQITDRPRLVYRSSEDSGSSLSTLALFWPHPKLAMLADPREAAGRIAGLNMGVNADSDLGACGDQSLLTKDSLLAAVGAGMPSGPEAAQAWQAYFAFPDAFAAARAHELLIAQDLNPGDDLPTSENEDHGVTSVQRRTGLRHNIDEALEFCAEHGDAPLSHPDLARIAAFSPANSAYRSLATIAGPDCDLGVLWQAAFLLADALRSLFNRPTSMALLDQVIPDPRLPYWRKVLLYCADGNLQAVLDEYVFLLWSESGQAAIGSAEILDIARRAASALQLRSVRYRAHAANLGRHVFNMEARFALRYGGTAGKAEADANVARQSDVRAAFNSPFAPFVLASTSVGQEGIDFHWWSHSVVHWNLPTNPVDFEQREGRVNRYAGHSVRKNVAAAHRAGALVSDAANPWVAAFQLATDQSDAGTSGTGGLGEFSPWWVYPGSSRIQRVLAQYPMSRDIEKYERLKNELALYRLTLGQPRQEDMVEMLARRGADAADIAKIDLRPPTLQPPE